MKTKHTPGPWIVEQQPMLTIYSLRIEKMNIEFISNEEAEANRKLIESAPELLKALITSIDIVRGYQYGHNYERNSVQLIKQVDSLIKKILI
jgi:hypothetical protein